MKRIIALVFFALAFLPGCGGGGDKDARPNVQPDVQARTLSNIEITPARAVFPLGVQEQLRATAIWSDQTSEDITEKAQWSSDQTAVVTTDGGRVQALGVGSATIKVAYGGLTKEAIVEVTEAKLTSIEIDGPSLLPLGETASFTALGIYTDQNKVKLTDQAGWTSSDPKVVQVAEGGQVKAVAPGKAQITAVFDGREKTVDIRIEPIRVISLRITSAPLERPEETGGGSTETAEELKLPLQVIGSFKVYGIYNNGTDADLTAQAEWTSENSAIAQFSGTPGRFFGAGIGNTKIQVRFENVSARAPVSIFLPDSANLRIDPVEQTIAPRMSHQYAVIGDFIKNGETLPFDMTSQVTWSSSDEKVATVSNAKGEQGLSKALDYGYTEIAATSKYGDVRAKLYVGTLQSVKVVVPGQHMHPNLLAPLQAIGYWDGGYSRDITTQAVWKSSAPEIADVSNIPGEEGMVSLKSKGITLITALYGKSNGQAKVEVTGAKPVLLRVQPEDALNPLRFIFPYTVDCRFDDGTVVDVSLLADWSIDDPAVVEVNYKGRKGRILTKSIGTANITAGWQGLVDSTSVPVVDPVPLELHAFRGVYGDGIDETEYWRQYQLPEVCDGDWCRERATVPASSALYTYRTYRLKANEGPVTIKNLGVVDKNGLVTAKFEGIEEGYTLAPGEEVTFHLVTNRPPVGKTSLVQWTFDAQGGTRYLQPTRVFTITGYVKTQ